MSMNDAMCKANRELLDRLGEAVIIFTQGQYVCIKGIFDGDYIDSYGINGFRPTLTCITREIETVTADNSTYERDGVNYLVRVKERDSFGTTRLILEKQNA